MVVVSMNLQSWSLVKLQQSRITQSLSTKWYRRTYLAQISLERRNTNFAEQWIFFFVVLDQCVVQTQQVQLALVKVHMVQYVPKTEQRKTKWKYQQRIKVRTKKNRQSLPVIKHVTGHGQSEVHV